MSQIRGTAQIGLGANVCIDDQGTGAAGNGSYTPFVNILSSEPPAPELTTTESKTLDIVGNTPKKIPGLFTAGTLTISTELVNANNTGIGIGQRDRLENIRISRSTRSFQFNFPTDGGFITITKDCFVKQNKIKPVTADGVQEMDTVLDVSGP